MCPLSFPHIFLYRGKVIFRRMYSALTMYAYCNFWKGKWQPNKETLLQFSIGNAVRRDFMGEVLLHRLPCSGFSWFWWRRTPSIHLLISVPLSAPSSRGPAVSIWSFQFPTSSSENVQLEREYQGQESTTHQPWITPAENMDTCSRSVSPGPRDSWSHPSAKRLQLRMRNPGPDTTYGSESTWNNSQPKGTTFTPQSSNVSNSLSLCISPTTVKTSSRSTSFSFHSGSFSPYISLFQLFCNPFC